jgi:hypothetical protein
MKVKHEQMIVAFEGNDFIAFMSPCHVARITLLWENKFLLHTISGKE